MMNYFDLPVIAKTTFMTALFVASCLSLTVFIIVAKRKKLLPKILLPICTIISFIFVVFYATEARIVKFSRDMPYAIKWVCETPIIVSISLLILCVAIAIFAFVKEMNERKVQPSRSSIKESLDKLPTGLCFYQENGKIILVNYSMNELCHKIVGRDLQNAKLFWEILSSGEVLPEIERLERGEHPSFRLKDGKVWTFSRTRLDGVIQLVGANTTDLSNVNAELKLKNVELSAINARLREYGEKVDSLTRTKERIDVKANIHRELGQALLITRRYLLGQTGNLSLPVDIWKKNVAMLTRESEITHEETPLSAFLESAEASGVKVQIIGDFPEDKKQNGLLVMAGAECLVNGVRHANANTLFITITQTDSEISATYENDGDLPTGEIVEGGGLSSLRHRTNRLEGKMEVKAKPKFSLTITLPKERSVEEWKN